MNRKRFGMAGCGAVVLALMVLAGCSDELTGEDPAVTGVTVTAAGGAAGVARGGTLRFTATVAGTDSPAQTVIWRITTSVVDPDTSIDNTGLLTVALREAVTSIEVTATSTVDGGKSGAASVSVSNVVSVTGVTVTPARASVTKGQTVQLSAAVAGTNSPVQSVIWNITTTGITPGTTINSAGLLTVAAGETASVITVRAVSAIAPSRSGQATVTVR
jgi:hypothetical protein